MAGGSAIRGSRVGAGPMGEAERGDAAWRGGKYDEAVELFRRFSTSRELADFLTIAAYERLVAEESGNGGGGGAGRARM